MKTTEEFLIECFCDETEEWVAIEISPNPWPLAGGPAEELVNAGSRSRWTALNTTIGRCLAADLKANR